MSSNSERRGEFQALQRLGYNQQSFNYKVHRNEQYITSCEPELHETRVALHSQGNDGDSRVTVLETR